MEPPPRDENLLFDEAFTVIDTDCDPTVGSKVDRIHCLGERTRSDLLLDIYTPALKLVEGDVLEILVVKEVQDPHLDFAPNGDPIPRVDYLDTSTILDKFEAYPYIVNGKVFSIKDKVISGNPVIAIYISFGGLIFRLQTLIENISGWYVDNEVFLCARKRDSGSKSKKDKSSKEKEKEKEKKREKKSKHKDGD